MIDPVPRFGGRDGTRSPRPGSAGGERAGGAVQAPPRAPGAAAAAEGDVLAGQPETTPRPKERSPSRRIAYRATALALCAVAWFLRWHALGEQSLWYDEALSVSQATESLRALVINLATTDVHPPLYFTLLHYWIGGAGQSEVAVRALSALASTFAVAALVTLGTRLVDARTGLAAGALGCFSPLLVYYGQETRMYALLAVLSTLAGYAFLRAANGEGRWWLPYTVLMAAALWTQLYAALLLLALNVWYVLDAGWAARRRTKVIHAASGGTAPRFWTVRLPFGGSVASEGAIPVSPLLSVPTGGTSQPPALRKHRHNETSPISVGALGAWAGAQLAAVLLFAPWLPIAWGNLRGYTSPGHGSPFGWMLSQTAIVFNLGYPADGPVRLPWLSLPLPPATLAAYLVAPGLLALCLGLVALQRQRLLLICWLLVPLVAMYLLSLGKRDFNARYLMEAFPAFVILAAAGLAALWRRRGVRPLGGALGLAVASVALLTICRIYADPAYARDDVRGAVGVLATQAAPRAAVVMDAPYLQTPFAYYAHGRWPVAPMPGHLPLTAASATPVLERFTADRSQIWLLLWQDYYSDPQEVVWYWLWQHFYLADWVDIHGGIKVLRFDALPASGLLPSGATLGDQVQLVGYTTLTQATVGGAQVHLDLYWRTLARPASDMAIAAHLLDGAGNDYGDADGTPADGRLPMTSWQPGDLVHTVTDIPLRPWTAPGAYRVQVRVYDHHTGVALAAAGPGATGDSVLLPLAVGPIAPAGGAAPALPASARPVNASFAGAANLAGYQVVAGENGPTLVLYWRALSATPSPLTVFVHALDAAGRTIGSGDSAPEVGAAPTTSWQPGELVRDPHRVIRTGAGVIDAYEVGLYDARTGLRLQARLANGRTALNSAIRLSMSRAPSPVHHGEY